MNVPPVIPSSVDAGALSHVFTSSCPTSVSAMALNPNFPKPKLLDFLDPVTVPSNGDTFLATQLEDLSKVLDEISMPTLSPRGAWKDKVGGSSVGRVNLEFIPPQVINDRIVVSPPAEDKFGISDVLANDSGFFFFVFAHDGDLFRVLEAGPWLIGGKLLVLQKWKPHMALIKEQLQSPLYCDKVTAKCKRMNFAKVCVEVNLDSSFPESFDLICPNGDSVIVNIKYPWHPLKCLRCKVFGHSDAHCPTKPKPIPGATLVETVGTPVQARSVSLGGTKPDVAVSPPREVGPKDLGHSQLPPMLATICAKDVVQSPSRIRICDDATIEKVVAQYTKNSELGGSNSEKQSMVDSLFPSAHDMKDIGFVTRPSAALTSNRFSPLSAKEANIAIGGSDIIASSSTAMVEVVDQPVEPAPPMSQEVVILPLPQEGKGKAKGRGAGHKPKLPQ
ncbi:hypothetical protein RHSIM_Rhsim04G0160400 [Rhododendron simsii]|uniref:DUF4283 domain-containing protein n=1 Tax=Rhododendron simsii TaxID=118357 RepID=A0A834H1N5_RHOSS|nr:hypothetical protein RHSIM_Rhsim04G0160400 [Rhododendron simsii]